MGGQWRLRTSIWGFKNEVLRVSHFPNYSKLRTSTPPNLHFFKEAGSKVGWHWMYQVVFLSSKVHLVFKVLLAIKVMSNVLFASKVFLVSKGLAEMVSVF